MPRRSVDEAERLADDVEEQDLEDELDEDEDLEELDEPLDEELDEDLADEGVEDASDEDEDDESLDAILTERVTDGRAEDDEPVFASSRDDTVIGELRPRLKPVKEVQEFVCARCHLVKARSQLADPTRRLCRDCV